VVIVPPVRIGGGGGGGGGGRGEQKQEEEEEEERGGGERSHRIVWAERETAIDIFLDYFTLTSLVHSVRLAGLGWAAGRGRSVKGREWREEEGGRRGCFGWMEREGARELRTSQPQQANDHNSHEWANLFNGITNRAGWNIHPLL